MLAESIIGHNQVVGNRYLLKNQLGAGGMGIVYRAKDNLTGDMIALKSLILPGESLDFKSQATLVDADDIRLILAQEFRMLASLRHPHIISVIDYGFDAVNQPYFTMELLDNPQTLVAAGKTLQLKDQITLLVQTLQALAYLHRRGVVHRDLKPENVQVIDGTVRVLDFGLAVSREFTSQGDDTLSGTLPYMAPELFGGALVSDKSDLYAIGVMAYELFAGRHPIDYHDLDILTFADEVRSHIPDVSVLPVPEAIQVVISRLLAKSADERYENANRAIVAFCEASEIPIPPETKAIRESYLQAAQFVGREVELKQLSRMLARASAGLGSAWLIGGESGVGKSRLLYELRIRALVQGVLVLRDEARETDNRPYQAFRGVLRNLVLLAPLSELEASVVKVILPDIETLLGRTIQDPPELDPDRARLRLHSTVSTLVQRVQQPMVIVIEDLQWASNETLDLLRWITSGVSDQPLLLIGSYRNDEVPRLPSDLPDMNRIHLNRLSSAEITQLSVSMLGNHGTNPEVIALLQRETEGNVFFMVEVVRALAEEVGRLEEIGKTELPERVFSWGIQTIIQHRLDRIAPEDRSLLQMAAIAGRELDLVVLEALSPASNIERWLTDCSEVAVLEVQDAQWRFAHDRLREATLVPLQADEYPDLHRHIAIAIEHAYEDVSEQVGQLAYHWAQAGDTQKECTYCVLAGKQMAMRYANVEAAGYLQRALELATENRISIMYELAKIWETSSQWNNVENILRQAVATVASSDEEKRILARCYSMLGNLSISLNGDYTEGYASLEKAQQIFESVGEWDGLIEAKLLIGRALVSQGDYSTGLSYFEQQYAHAVEIDYLFGANMALRNIGHVYAQQGQFERALSHYQQSLKIAVEIDDLKSISTNYSSLGVLYTNMGNLSRALEYYLLQLENFKRMGDVDNSSETIISIGNLYMLVGDYSEALICCEQGVRDTVQTGHYLGCSIGLIYLAMCYAGQERFQEAKKVANLAVDIVRRLQKTFHLAGYLTDNAELHFAAGDYQTAMQLGDEALEIINQINSQFALVRVNTLAVRVRHALGLVDTANAVQQLGAMLTQSIEPVEEANLLYTIWQIDNEQQEALKSAISLFYRLYDESPQIHYQKCYAEMTGVSLPVHSPLPPLPELIESQPVDLQLSLRQIVEWLEGSSV